MNRNVWIIALAIVGLFVATGVTMVVRPDRKAEPRNVHILEDRNPITCSDADLMLQHLELNRPAGWSIAVISVEEAMADAGCDR